MTAKYNILQVAIRNWKHETEINNIQYIGGGLNSAFPGVRMYRSSMTVEWHVFTRVK